jgi:DNA-binding CsgD family transcriptional regulator
VTESVRDRDLRRLLAVIEAARSIDVADGVPIGVLDRVQALVACDLLSFVELDTARQVCFFDQSVPDGGDDNPGDQDPGDSAFWRHYWDSLSCAYPDRTGDERSVTTTSDFYTQRQWHNTAMYVDYFGPLGYERDAMLCISAPAGRTRRLLFFRGSGADFDGRDRLLLSLLRPLLSELYQELERRRRRVPDLTPRQWELLRLVASGRTNAEIALDLVVTKHTVRKHLENIFVRLDVTTRTGAVAHAFPTGPY